MIDWIHDAVALVGVLLLALGVGLAFGWPFAAITAGVTLLGLSIIGARNAAIATR